MKALVLSSTGALLVVMLSSCGTSTPSGTTGTGGTAGGGGTGGDTGAGGTAADLPSIVSVGTGIDNYGTWFSPTAASADNQAFLITPCSDSGTGFDCANNGPTGVCPAGGYRFTEVFEVTGGDPTKIYDVSIHVLGQVEPKIYQQGSQATGFTAANPNGVNDLLYTGGQVAPNNPDYNVFDMTIDPPTDGTAIPDAPTFYAFNAVDNAHAGAHYNFEVDETFTFKVMTGFTITLLSFDSNCRAIMNCGNGGPYGFNNAAACTAVARSVPGVTLPVNFRGVNLANGGAQPFQTQFLNLKITGVVAE